MLIHSLTTTEAVVVQGSFSSLCPAGKRIENMKTPVAPENNKQESARIKLKMVLQDEKK